MAVKITQEEVAELLRTESTRRWPDGVIPAAEGGAFFREMSDRVTGCTEGRLSDMARELKLWPWKVEDIGRAHRASEQSGAE